MGGYGLPGEGFFYSSAAGFAHGSGFGGVVEDGEETGGEGAGEFVGMGGESGDGILFKGDEAAGDAFDDDFEDASCGAGDDGSVAGHGFEIDDAEGLVDGGAAEDGAVAVELDGGGAGEHLLDPDDVGVSAAGGVDFCAHLCGNFRGVGGAGAEDDLRVAGQVREGVDEVGDAFLAGDATEEEDVGAGGVDAVGGESGGVGGGLVLVQVDAVVDDVDAVGIDGGIGAEDVGFGALGDGDDGVGGVDGGVLHPRRHGVAAAELLGFPGAEGLEGVGGEDVGRAVEFFGEEAGHGDVPGVGVDDVDLERLDLEEVEAEGFQRGGEFLRGAFGESGPRLLAADVEAAVVGVLLAPAVDFDVDGAGELAAEVFDVDAGASINGGRVFAGHQANAQGTSRETGFILAECLWVWRRGGRASYIGCGRIARMRMRWKSPGWWLALAVMGCGTAVAQSVYPLRPDDAHAVYLTRAEFGAVGDGVADDADALQRAIDRAQETVHHGIVFVPEGRYRLGHTVEVWAGIRLIGYGAKRPVFVLGAGTPGFGEGEPHPMLWFTDERGQASTDPKTAWGAGASLDAGADASEFTFFSAVSNIDFEIGAGNPAAVAVRFNVAQHSFVAHADFELGDARAALEQVGNQAYDIHVHGGQYGIETGKTSPAWQFLLMDSSFDGQTKAAISTHEAGMTLVRDRFSHMPVAVTIPEGQVEQLYGRDLVMRDVRGVVLKMGDTQNVRDEITLENVVCDGVGEFAADPQVAGYRLQVTEAEFVEQRFTLGMEIAADGRERGIHEEHKEKALSAAEEKTAEGAALKTDIPALPPMSTWVNVRTLGVKGDGETDDTKAIQKAIDNHKVLYFPSGFYRLRGPLWLWGDTTMIGFSPFTTQFVLADHDAEFQGAGAPIAMVVAPEGGGNIVTGIGIATGNGNPRAMGVEWQAGAHSLLEDVDFWDGRSEYVEALEPAAPRPLPRGQRTPLEMNAQYQSLWVKGGGGVLRGIWSHATTAKAGLVIEDSKVPGAIYQFSCEHHVENEVRLERAQNWRIYDLQTEEENPAGQDAVPVDLKDAHDVTFANTYMYRVSRTVLPKAEAVAAEDADGVSFDNVKVFSQTRLAFDDSVQEEGGVEVRAHDFVHFAVTKGAQPGAPLPLPGAFAAGATLERVATGFSNADGLTADADGTVYFTDAAKNTVYELDPEGKKAEAIAKVPQSPMAVAVAAPGVLVTLNRDASASEIVKTDGGGWTETTLPSQAGPLMEGTRLLLPVGLHAPLEKLTLLLEHRGYQFRAGSNTAIRSGLEDVPASYFYATDGKMALPAMPIPMFRNVHESSQLAAFATGETRLVTSEDDARTWRATLEKDGGLKTELFAERGGTSVVEDSAGNVYIASGQIYVYDRAGHEEGALEVPERPGSLCFGGKDGKTLFIGARGSVYAVRVRARGGS